MNNKRYNPIRSPGGRMGTPEHNDESHGRTGMTNSISVSGIGMTQGRYLKSEDGTTLLFYQESGNIVTRKAVSYNSTYIVDKFRTGRIIMQSASNSVSMTTIETALILGLVMVKSGILWLY